MTFRIIFATFAMLLGLGQLWLLSTLELAPIRGFENAFWWTLVLFLCAYLGTAYVFYQLGHADGKREKALTFNDGVEAGRMIASGLIKDGRVDKRTSYDR